MNQITKQIEQIEAKAAYLGTCLPLMCPNHPKERTCDGFDRFVIVFSRSLKRYCFFLKSLIDKIDKEVSIILSRDSISKQDFATKISDDVFFILDAYLFSCRSLFEKNIYFKNNNISRGLAKKLGIVGSNYETGSLHRILKSMRDEVTHINVYGSGIGSMIQFTNTAQGLKHSIPTEFTNDKNERLCLSLITTDTWQMAHPLISDIFDIVYTETIIRYGTPKQNSTFHWGESSVKPNDFNFLTR